MSIIAYTFRIDNLKKLFLDVAYSFKKKLDNIWDLQSQNKLEFGILTIVMAFYTNTYQNMIGPC